MCEEVYIVVIFTIMFSTVLIMGMIVMWGVVESQREILKLREEQINSLRRYDERGIMK